MITLSTIISAIISCIDSIFSLNYSLETISYIVDALGNVPITQVMNRDEGSIIRLLI